jgi:hypothetical protein
MRLFALLSVAAAVAAPAPSLEQARLDVWHLRKVAFRYFTDHQSFAGMTGASLRRYNRTLPRSLRVPPALRVAWAGQFSFCLEEAAADGGIASLAFDAHTTRYTLRSAACPTQTRSG